MERYIGLDPHGTSCTFGVIGPSGRQLHNDVVETNGKALAVESRFNRGFPLPCSASRLLEVAS